MGLLSRKDAVYLSLALVHENHLTQSGLVLEDFQGVITIISSLLESLNDY